MATIAQYKKYKRGNRQANVETDFSSGMMYSEGTIPEGFVKTLVNFDFTSDGKNALKPRAGYRTKEFILPDVNHISETDTFLDDDVSLKYSKECVEDGAEQRQFIFGHLVDAENNTGEIWAVTAPKSSAVASGTDYSFNVSKSIRSNNAHSCKFYSETLTDIHEVPLASDAKSSFPVGAFLRNSFYFFSSDGELCKTAFDNASYAFEDLEYLDRTASEAVQYGYNMLKTSYGESPYIFEDRSGSSSSFQMEGILPYNGKFEGSSTPELIMTPRAHSRVWFRCNYDIPTGGDYKIIWSWKELTADEWTVFNTVESVKASVLPILQADLIVPAKEIMVRCEAYNNEDASDTVEKAMTVGFDFTTKESDTAVNSAPIEYDLSTASGMTAWNNRLVLWGTPKDPTILWVSDLDEPTYFPYPNNVIVFDEPIISAIEFMDSLVVFTKSKAHQVTIAEDGVSFASTVIQSNLYINPWDKHLIQVVRNMVYFKSGNYYYMLVPKAQSLTGELTLAPITTPITDFFNDFSRNVSEVFNRCYKNSDGIPTDPTHSYDGLYTSTLVTYYNFLDYEFIHNLYVYKFEYDDQTLYIHFDVMYNTATRYWKVCVYESPHFLFPFRNDATQRGLLATSSVVDTTEGHARAIQILGVDDSHIDDLYLPSVLQYQLKRDPTYPLPYVRGNALVLPDGMADVDEFGESGFILFDDPEMHNVTQPYLGVIIDSNAIRTRKLILGMLDFYDSVDYVGGFNVTDLADTFTSAVKYLKDHTVFYNKQFLDTGYREASPFINKRYRELQLQINNLDNVDMEFGMDFNIAGEPRNTYFKYEVSQVIDELYQDRAIVYLDATPYMEIPADGIDKSNLWTIHNSLTPDISLYKVRAAISGKGVAPRMRLYTRNQFNYQLLGMNWIYREMNMR